MERGQQPQEEQPSPGPVVELADRASKPQLLFTKSSAAPALPTAAVAAPEQTAPAQSAELAVAAPPELSAVLEIREQEKAPNIPEPQQPAVSSS